MTSPRPDTLNQSTLVERLRKLSSRLQTAMMGVQFAEINEAADTIEALCEALQKIADAPAWGYPDKWETTPAEVRQLARAAIGKATA